MPRGNLPLKSDYDNQNAYWIPYHFLNYNSSFGTPVKTGKGWWKKVPHVDGLTDHNPYANFLLRLNRLNGLNRFTDPLCLLNLSALRLYPLYLAPCALLASQVSRRLHLTPQHVRQKPHPIRRERDELQLTAVALAYPKRQKNVYPA